ncbi:MAG: hypothetical protein QXS29_10530 [Nitrososphaeria archaeon]
MIVKSGRRERELGFGMFSLKGKAKESRNTGNADFTSSLFTRIIGRLENLLLL